MKKNLNITYLNGAEGMIRRGGASSGGSGNKEESVGAAILALDIDFSIENSHKASNIGIDLLKMKVIPNTFNTGIVTRIEKLDTIPEILFGKVNNLYDIVIDVESEQIYRFRTKGMNFCLTACTPFEIAFVVNKDDFSTIDPTYDLGPSSGRIYQYNDIDVNSIYLLFIKPTTIAGEFLTDAIRINSPKINY